MQWKKREDPFHNNEKKCKFLEFLERSAIDLSIEFVANQFMKRVLAIALVLLMILSLLGGCYSQTDVLVVDGYGVYPGLYLYFQLQAISMASQKLDDVYTGKELYKQYIDDVLVRDWINDKTIELAKEFVFVENSFKRLELDETNVELEMQYYDSSLRDEWSSVNYFYIRNGVGYVTFRKAYENYIKSNQLFTALYITEGGELEVPEAEVKDTFIQKYTYLDYVKIPKVDDDGAELTETKIQKARDDIKAMKAVAEAAVMEEGVLFIYPENIGLQAAYEYYAEINGLTEEEIANSKGKVLSEHTVVGTSSTIYEAEFITALFEADYDTFMTYEAEDAVYLFCRRSMLDFNEDSWLDYRGSIISEIRGDAYITYIEESSVALEYTENKGARRYFSMNKAIY